jgi:hypothetical protein
VKKRLSPKDNQIAVAIVVVIFTTFRRKRNEQGCDSVHQFSGNRRASPGNYLSKLTGLSPQLFLELRAELDAEAIAKGLPPITPERRVVKRGKQTYLTAERKSPKPPVDREQKFVDRVVGMAQKFDAARRGSLAEKLYAALRVSPPEA